MPKKKREVTDIAVVDMISSRNRLADMLEKSGYRSKFLERLAGKRED